MKKLTREQLEKLSKELANAVLASNKGVFKTIETHKQNSTDIYVEKWSEDNTCYRYCVEVDYCVNPHFTNDEENTFCESSVKDCFFISKMYYENYHEEQLPKKILSSLLLLQERIEYYLLCKQVTLLEVFEEKVPEELLNRIRKIEDSQGSMLSNTLTEYEEENE